MQIRESLPIAVGPNFFRSRIKSGMPAEWEYFLQQPLFNQIGLLIVVCKKSSSVILTLFLSFRPRNVYFRDNSPSAVIPNLFRDLKIIIEQDQHIDCLSHAQ